MIYVVKEEFDLHPRDNDSKIIYAGADPEEAFTAKCEEGYKLVMEVWKEKVRIAELYSYGDNWYPKDGQYIDDIEAEIDKIHEEIDKLAVKASDLAYIKKHRDKLYEERAIEKINPEYRLYDPEEK